MERVKIVVLLVVLISGCFALPTSPPSPSSVATKVSSDKQTPATASDEKTVNSDAMSTATAQALPPRNNISPPPATAILLPPGLVDHTKYKPTHVTVSQSTGGIQTAVPIPGQVDPNKKPMVGTQPLHPAMTLPAKIEDAAILNAQPGLVDPNKKSSVGVALNTKPAAVHTPTTLPAQVSNNDNVNVAQNSKPSLVDPIMKPIVNAPQNFAKPAIHTPVVLPAQIMNTKDNLNMAQNEKPAIHTPVVLPAQIMNTKDNLNMAQNEKPAIQTPVTLPLGQVDPNKKPNLNNAALSVSTQPIHTPMTLPANVAPNGKPGLVDPIKIPIGGVNVPQNAKPVVHTPMTLPAQISSTNSNVNVPQNFAKPSIHTPAVLPAQIMNTKDNLNMAQNEKPAIQTPVTLPLGQVDPNKKPNLNNAAVSTQNIHTPMTLPAQILQDKKENINADSIKKPATISGGVVASDSTYKIKPAENSKPANLMSTKTNEEKDEKVIATEIKPAIIHTPVTLPAQSNSNNAVLSVKPAIHNPVTLLPHISGDKKTDVISTSQTPPGNSDKRAVVVAELKKPVAYYPQAQAASLDVANVNIGGAAQPARIKRQYFHRPATLPARVPAGGFQNNRYGSFNGGYQGIQPIPAIVNRPAGGQLRG